MPKGKRWTTGDIAVLQEGLKKHEKYKDVQEEYFPERTTNSVAQAARKYCSDDIQYNRSPDWRTKELKLLQQVIDEHAVKTWKEVARHIPGRNANACKQAAYKRLRPPEGRRHFLAIDQGYIRRHGPSKRWVQELGKIYNKAFEASGVYKADIVRNYGISRMTVDRLQQGLHVPRMALYVQLCHAVSLDPGKALTDALVEADRLKANAAKGGNTGGWNT